YYAGSSNAALWPLYHAGIVSPLSHRAWRERYAAAHPRCAEAAARAAASRKAAATKVEFFTLVRGEG
ncbi:hypothetical protein J8J27_22125, partial [Mycobacterium tuberculosis]|nr:hypothetical protein [Mycobacterium tuberculosis]